MLHYQNIRQYQMQQEHLHNLMLESQGAYKLVDGRGHVPGRRPSLQPPFDEGGPKEYAGYWINDSPPSHPYREDYRMPRIPQLHDLYPRVRGVPPPLGRLQGESRSPSPSHTLPIRDRAFSLQSAPNGPSVKQRLDRVPGTAPSSRMHGPIIVNGTDALQLSEPPPTLESDSRTTTVSETTSGSDEHPYQTPNTAETESYYNGLFEEGFAIDQAQHLYHNNQMADRFRQMNADTRTYMEPSSRRLSNQQPEAAIYELGLKPVERRQNHDRGLNIQFGELDYARPHSKPEPRPMPEPARPPENAATTGPPPPITKDQDQSDKTQSTVPLLSPVREVRTPSPAGKRKDDGVNMAKISSIKRAAGKMDLHIPSWAELVRNREEKEVLHDTPGTERSANEGLASKVNGVRSPGTMPVLSPRQVPVPPHNTPISGMTKMTQHQQLPNGWQQQPSRKHKKNKSRTESGHDGESVPIAETQRKGG